MENNIILQVTEKELDVLMRVPMENKSKFAKKIMEVYGNHGKQLEITLAQKENIIEFITSSIERYTKYKFYSNPRFKEDYKAMIDLITKLTPKAKPIFYVNNEDDFIITTDKKQVEKFDTYRLATIGEIDYLSCLSVHLDCGSCLCDGLYRVSEGVCTSYIDDENEDCGFLLV